MALTIGKICDLIELYVGKAGVDKDVLTRKLIREVINMRLKDFTDDSAVIEQSATFSTTSGTREYQLGADKTHVKEVWFDGYKADKSTFDQLIELAGTLTTLTGATPDISTSFSGISFEFQTFTDGDTTPSVSGYVNFKASNTSSTTITDFDDYNTTYPRILVLATNANTTIAHNANIELQGGVNYTMESGDILEFVYNGTVWVQVEPRNL